jgi:uncharacterized membrane protein YdbT with pleckstrin-like domain
MALVSNGMVPMVAVLVLAGVVLLIVMILIVLAVAWVRRLRDLPVTFFGIEPPRTGRVNHVIDSFLHGLLTPRKRGKPESRLASVKEGR